MNFLKNLNNFKFILIISLSALLVACGGSRVPPKNSTFINGAPASLAGLYTALNTTFPQYENKTYAKPALNYLKPDWLLQTPNAWGKPLSTYNNGLSPRNGQSFNQKYQAPSCQSSAYCSAGRTCVAANFANGQKLCLGNANKIQQYIYNTIVSAKHFVYITTLQPSDNKQPIISTGAFTPTLKNAIVALARRSENSATPIYVRLLQGSFSPIHRDNRGVVFKHIIDKQRAYMKNIVATLPQGNKLIISIALQRSCALSQPGNCGNENQQRSLYLSTAWNHGKIIDVDGKHLITGGENLWGNDYLTMNPVNDTNMEITGPVAQGATNYVNQLWQFVYQHHKRFKSNECMTYNYQSNAITNNCPDDFPTLEKPGTTGLGLPVMAMFIAKLDNGVLGKDADQSELARVYAFNHAVKHIQISQQALFYKFGGKILHPLYTIGGTVMQALANALSKGVTVDIVTSNMQPNQKGYSSEVLPQFVYNYLFNLLVKEQHLTSQAATETLHNYLHLKTISYQKNDPNHNEISSHNKIWIADGHLFYIGSHNIYPSSLQQFGVILDSKTATNLLEQQWWHPLWKNAVNAPLENSA